jgi:hypothetical protein
LFFVVVQPRLRRGAASAEIGVVGVLGQEPVEVPESGEPLLLPLAVVGLLAVAKRPNASPSATAALAA